MDLYNRVWECNDRDADYVCPGEFNTLCPKDEFAVQCGCVGEVWMVPDCQEVQNIFYGPSAGSREAIQYFQNLGPKRGPIMTFLIRHLSQNSGKQKLPP